MPTQGLDWDITTPSNEILREVKKFRRANRSRNNMQESYESERNLCHTRRKENIDVLNTSHPSNTGLHHHNNDTSYNKSIIKMSTNIRNCHAGVSSNVSKLHKVRSVSESPKIQYRQNNTLYSYMNTSTSSTVRSCNTVISKSNTIRDNTKELSLRLKGAIATIKALQSQISTHKEHSNRLTVHIQTLTDSNRNLIFKNNKLQRQLNEIPKKASSHDKNDDDLYIQELEMELDTLKDENDRLSLLLLQAKKRESRINTNISGSDKVTNSKSDNMKLSSDVNSKGIKERKVMNDDSVRLHTTNDNTNDKANSHRASDAPLRVEVNVLTKELKATKEVVNKLQKSNALLTARIRKYTTSTTLDNSNNQRSTINPVSQALRKSTTPSGRKVSQSIKTQLKDTTLPSTSGNNKPYSNRSDTPIDPVFVPKSRRKKRLGRKVIVNRELGISDDDSDSSLSSKEANDLDNNNISAMEKYAMMKDRFKRLYK